MEVEKEEKDKKNENIQIQKAWETKRWKSRRVRPKGY